jgi:predicted amidohydrolase
MISRTTQSAQNHLGRFSVWLVFLLCGSNAPVTWSQEPSEGARVRVAAISMVPEKLNLDSNSARLEGLFRQAATGGAQLAVAPEGVLDGYIVNEIIAGKIEAQRMRDVAVTIDSPVIGRFRDLALELKMCLVFGFAELVQEDVFNCAVFIDDRGGIAGKYHKMQLAEGYSPEWWFNRMGKASRAFDTPFGRCGILICNDRWNPDLARIPALDGAQFLVIPAFGSRSVQQDESVLNRARENQLPLVEANVGVSLIVSQGTIQALSRQEDGVTFGEIQIPPARKIDPVLRDALEKQFLDWRADEMPKRLDRYLQKAAQQAETSLSH